MPFPKYLTYGGTSGSPAEAGQSPQGVFTNTALLRGCGTTRTRKHVNGSINCTAALESSLVVTIKVEPTSPCDPMILILGLYSRES